VIVKVGCSIGLQGCRIEDEIEVDDNATQEDIEQQVKEWAMGHFDYWSDAEAGGKP
jgi:hypothetical protein